MVVSRPICSPHSSPLGRHQRRQKKLGLLLADGRVWRPAAVEAQAKQAPVADVVRTRSFQLVDAGGKERATRGTRWKAEPPRAAW